jgi:Mg-chelatase subunit ChlD
MPSASVRRFSPFALVLVLSLSLAGCGKSSSSGSDASAGEGSYEAAADATAAPARVTSKRSEWNVGGVVSGRTVTVVREPIPGPPVITEPPFPSEPQPAPQSGLLTAGDVDDLLNPAQYAAYAGRFLQEHGQDLPFVDTRTRVAIKVVDASGRPVPFARAEVRRSSGAPLQLVTAADGTASFYPRLDKLPAQTTIAVSSTAGSASRSVSLAGARLIPIDLSGTSRGVSAMDLALVIDTTGSMGDEMAYLRAELDTIVARLKRTAGNLDLRIGVILFRDEGDAYVVRSTALTDDVSSIRSLLTEQEADGGGDAPEAMDQAMAAAGRLQWRPDAAKAVLLVTDAPPHDENVAAAIGAAQQLRSRGVQIVPVAASGVEDRAQYVLRTMAALTQGRYIFLTDDSGIGNEHAEPDVACYVVTHLDQLVARVLAGIATGQRVEPRAEDVIRTVGDYDKGRCRASQQT